VTKGHNSFKKDKSFILKKEVAVSELMADFALEFEKPVKELENQIKELKGASDESDLDLSREIKALHKKVETLKKQIYSNLSPWERTQLSRHPNRPHTIDYINEIITDFHELYGDRKFANDSAMITGFGLLDGHKVAVIGIEKGRKTKEKIQRNFGMPQPEGYRKALRVMKLASQFKVPIITFIDTPGAYPGIGAEERGQANAIAENLMEMFSLQTPIISVVIGEGGSGGALGIGISDRTYMMEYSIYSVISPESCASILWADPKNAEKAANALKLDPETALSLEVIDGIIKEPAGGAHQDPEMAFVTVKKTLVTSLKEMEKQKIDQTVEERFQKFRRMGNKTLIQPALKV
jgi:acetyl-CoA carboxylase carboxyl transferase subunit alpha